MSNENENENPNPSVSSIAQTSPKPTDTRKGSDTARRHIRISAETLDRLEAAAEERMVGREYLVDRALREYLDALIPIEDVTLTRGVDAE